jgi:hypothetical protein
MREKHLRQIPFIFLVFVVIAVLLTKFPPHNNIEKTNLSKELNASTKDSRASDVLSEMLIQFSSRREEKWLPYNVSGYEEGFEGLVSNGTAGFRVAVFVYRNLSECRKWFESIENELNASFSVVNSSTGESCRWGLFSGNRSYYLECSRFWGRGVLLIVSGSNEKAVERLTWWFPTQSCVRPGTKLVVQTGSPEEINGG